MLAIVAPARLSCGLQTQNVPYKDFKHWIQAGGRVAMLKNLVRRGFITAMGTRARPRLILRGLASGYRMDISPSKYLGYLLGSYEPHLQKVIRNFVRNGDTAYDIGANVGYVSLCLARVVGNEGKVISFEPIPETAEELERNLILNGVTNVRVVACAASDKLGMATFRIPESAGTASMVWHRREKNVRKVDVRCVAIDDEIASGRFPIPSFLKIDVEGAEAFVIQGMKDTISSARPVIFVECSDQGRESTWNTLRSLNYSCFSAASMNSIHSFNDYRHSDFLWLPVTAPFFRYKLKAT